MRTQTALIGCALLLAALGCRDDVGAPTEPTVQHQGPAAATALDFWQLSAGGSHTCAVTTDDRGFCWGSNGAGQLGVGSIWEPVFSTLPIAVTGDLPFKQVAAGQYHTCGVTTDGRLYCWGAGNHGQLGDGTLADHDAPVRVAGTLRFRQVSAGITHTCGVTADFRAYCWGEGSTGKLGNGTTTIRMRPYPWPVGCTSSR
jgi:alpha-tubulin suppressor-like RCC1 family protein